MEVLLIKITSLDGEGIDSCEFIRRKLAGLNIESMTAEEYADDLTLIFKMSAHSVQCIVHVLNGFTEVTGLEINKEKTQLMVVGSDEWGVDQKVHDIKLVSCISLLGVKIDRTLTHLDENWEKVVAKMRRLSGYWSNFGLSIAGRVMVAKTYLISQAIYTMSILPLPTRYGDIMNDILVNFVSGRDRTIERRRQFLCVSTGGYGMSDMNDMNVYIKSVWIRRIKDMIDNLDYIAVIMVNNRQVLAEGGPFDYEQVGNNMSERTGGPILYDIVRKWGIFKMRFYEVGNNYVQARLFGNVSICENENTLEMEVFGGGRSREIR
jgi:hypothetical protein